METDRRKLSRPSTQSDPTPLRVPEVENMDVRTNVEPRRRQERGGAVRSDRARRGSPSVREPHRCDQTRLTGNRHGPEGFGPRPNPSFSPVVTRSLVHWLRSTRLSSTFGLQSPRLPGRVPVPRPWVRSPEVTSPNMCHPPRRPPPPPRPSNSDPWDGGGRDHVLCPTSRSVHSPQTSPSAHPRRRVGRPNPAHLPRVVSDVRPPPPLRGSSIPCFK